MGERSKKRLGEILIEDGILSREELEEALKFQKKEGGLIGQILIRLGYLSEESLTSALAKQLKIPYLPLANYSINTDTSHELEEDYCRRNLVIAFDRDEKKVFLAIGDYNESVVSEIGKKMNLKPKIFLSTPTEILNMLDLVFNSQSLKKTG